MSIYYPGDESLSKAIVSERVILVKRRLFMWMYFFGGMAVAVLAIGLGILLWHFDKLKVQSWGHMILGIACAIVVIALAFQLFTVGGFWAWCWKLPTTIVAGMVTIVAVDIGLHGDRTR